MTATRALIDTLKRRAGDIARPFIDAAEQPDATELERAFGEAARVILRDAETRALQLPKAEFERRVAAFTEWHSRLDAEMRRASRQECRGEHEPITEMRRRASRELDDREAEFHQWVESFAVAAWIRATEDLLTLDRPSAFITSQSSPAKH